MGILRLLSLLFLVSCGQFLKSNLSGEKSVFKSDFNFTYEYFDSNDQRQSKELPSTGKINVILLSSIGCSACKEEHLHVGELLSNGDINLDEVDLMTIHIPFEISEKEELLAERKTLLESSWSIGVDPDFYFFENHCPKKVTPCTLVVTSEGKISSVYNGSEKNLLNEINIAKTKEEK